MKYLYNIYVNSNKSILCIISVHNNSLPIGKNDGITESAHVDINSNASSADGESKSSKNIPPIPLRSSRCGIIK